MCHRALLWHIFQWLVIMLSARTCCLSNLHLAHLIRHPQSACSFIQGQACGPSNGPRGVIRQSSWAEETETWDQRPQPRSQVFCLLFRLALWPQTLTCHGLQHRHSILGFSAFPSLASSASPKPEACLSWPSLDATLSVPCNHSYLPGQHRDMWAVLFVNKTFFFQKINNYSSTVQLWPNAASVGRCFILSYDSKNCVQLT